MTISRLRVALLAAFGLVVADAMIGPDQADACSIAAVQEHEIDGENPDAVAPGAVSLVSVEVQELGDDPGGCGGSSSSCDGLGTISIVVEAEDDATPADSIGFTFELASGSLPSGLQLPDGPVRGWDRGDGRIDLVLPWSPDESDSMDFVVRVSAVDAAGNVGESTDIPVLVAEEGGCAAGGLPATGAVWLLALLAAMFVLRRSAERR